jgi:potassium channel subfamily K
VTDDHHYRYLLVSQINTLYRDLQDSADKRYSFAEWNFFLDLLGRDQAHKTPEHSSTGQSGSKLDVASWSWIENPNPLIEDENEPTWLLRMMLRKLEEDLLLEWRQRAREEDKEISPEKVR